MSCERLKIRSRGPKAILAKLTSVQPCFASKTLKSNITKNDSLSDAPFVISCFPAPLRSHEIPCLRQPPDNILCCTPKDLVEKCSRMFQEARPLRYLKLLVLLRQGIGVLPLMRKRSCSLRDKTDVRTNGGGCKTRVRKHLKDRRRRR